MQRKKIPELLLNYLMQNWLKEDYPIVLISFVMMVIQFLFYQRLHLLPDKFTLETTLIIPIVILGFCLGNVLSNSLFKKDDSNIKLILSIAVSMLISLFLSTKLRSAYDLKALLKCSLVLVYPFIFLGIFFGKIFFKKEKLGVIFLNNGVGLGLGAFFSGKIFKYFGDTYSFFLIYLILLAPVFINFRSETKKIFGLICSLILIIAFFKLGAFSPQIMLESQGGSALHIIDTRYSEFSRTDTAILDGQLNILTNGGSNTPIAKWEIPLSIADYLEINKQKKEKKFPYWLGNFNKVLIIGVGGGSDVLEALRYGCTDITGIEINPITIELVKNKYKDYSGGLYWHPYVKIINDEGRHFIEASNVKYDLIIIPNVDAKSSWRTPSPIALESYLYTKEAFKRYWEVLNKKGACLITWPIPKKAADYNRDLQGVRLFKTALSVLSAYRHEDNAILLFQKDKPDYIGYYLLILKGRLSQEAYAKINSEGFSVLYSSLQPGKFFDLKDKYVNEFNINETSDDRPTYHFFQYWWSNKSLLQALSALIIFIILIVCSPFLKRWAGFSNSTAFLFILIGVSFIVLEITLIEKISLFLGNPVYANQFCLFIFLFLSGIGGYLGVSIKERDIWKISFGIAGIVFLYLLIFNYINNLLYLPQLVKFIIVGLLVSVAGLLCGMPFAGLMSRIEKRHIAYAFDGLGSVAGGLFAWYGIINFGFTAVFLLVTIVYLLITFLLIYTERS